jgi:hypothetical protein
MARIEPQRHGEKVILKASPKKKTHEDDILDTFLAVVYNENTTANRQANFLNTSF